MDKKIVWGRMEPNGTLACGVPKPCTLRPEQRCEGCRQWVVRTLEDDQKLEEAIAKLDNDWADAVWNRRMEYPVVETRLHKEMPKRIEHLASLAGMTVIVEGRCTVPCGSCEHRSRSRCTALKEEDNE